MSLTNYLNRTVLSADVIPECALDSRADHPGVMCYNPPQPAR